MNASTDKQPLSLPVSEIWFVALVLAACDLAWGLSPWGDLSQSLNDVFRTACFCGVVNVYAILSSDRFKRS